MKRLLALAATASALTLAMSAQAATLWSFTGPGADGDVSATALVDLTGGTLTIDFTNLLANPTSAGQLISGIQIFFDDGPSAAALTTASGSEINITKGAKKGDPNVVTDVSDGVIDHWGTALSGESVFLATAGTGAEGGSPFNLIIGPGPYTNANASIMGDNPSIAVSGHFVLTLTGLADGADISGVRLAFGTTGTDYHDTICSIPGGGDCDDGGGGMGGVPEPATWAMMIMGFGAAGVMLRRRRTVFG